MKVGHVRAIGGMEVTRRGRWVLNHGNEVGFTRFDLDAEDEKRTLKTLDRGSFVEGLIEL